MTRVMQIRIPLKRTLTKIWVCLSRSRNPTKSAVGEPKVYKLELMSLQFDSVSVCVYRPPSKIGGRDLYL